METFTMAGRQEPVVAKRIYLHRNGLQNLRPKMIVVNERQIRDFSSFLNRVTSGIKAPIAVRNIYTPVGGSRVQRLEELQNGKHYVAGGNEHFKKIRYDRHLYGIQKHPQKHTTINTDMKIHHPIRTIQAVSRFRNLPEKPYLIHVFRNGDALFRGVRVLLPRKMMHSWEHVLELITDKAELTLPAKRLCTLEGQVIHAVTDIRDGEKYVALEGARRFIKLPYCGIDPAPHDKSSPYRQHQHHQMRLRRRISTITTSENTSLQNTIPLEQPKIKKLMPIKQHRGVERPFAGHRNKAARNKALNDARTDSAFGGAQATLGTSFTSEEGTSEDVFDTTRNLSLTLGDQASSQSDTLPRGEQAPPIGTRTDQKEDQPRSEGGVFHGTMKDGQKEKPISTEYQEEEGPGVFKKSREQTDVTEDVKESTDIVIERPIDHEEAREVDEVVTDEDTEPKLELKPPITEEITELKGQSLNDSIDLTAARKETEAEDPATPPSQNLTNNNKLSPKPGSRLASSKSTSPLNKSKPSSKHSSKIPSKSTSRVASTRSSPHPNKTPTTGNQQDNDRNNPQTDQQAEVGE